MAVRSDDDAVPLDAYALDRRRQLHDLYREHYRSMVRLAVILLDTTEAAEDVVQEAFVKLDGSWNRIEDPARTVSYLRSIVMNLARSKLRRRRLARTKQPPPDFDAPPAEDHAVLREDQREVVEALRALPGRQRDCLVLRYWGDLSEAEIAETLGISKGTVKSSTHRGIAALRDELEVRA